MWGHPDSSAKPLQDHNNSLRGDAVILLVAAEGGAVAHEPEPDACDGALTPAR